MPSSVAIGETVEFSVSTANPEIVTISPAYVHGSYCDVFVETSVVADSSGDVLLWGEQVELLPGVDYSVILDGQTYVCTAFDVADGLYDGYCALETCDNLAIINYPA